MNGFMTSFTPIIKRFNKFKVEIFLIGLALLIALISLIVFLKNNASQDEEIILENTQINIPQTKIIIEIAGAVNKPGVYEINNGSRLKDILTIAKGLSEEADQYYFTRNYNLARYISDQEKIYIPFSWEIDQGIIIENSRTLDYSQPNQTYSINNTTSSISEEKININTATVEELDQLPGIGAVTAQKIIQNRPYKTTSELSTRKIINKGVWEKIKELIVN